MNGFIAHRFVCKSCGHVQATWSSRCTRCFEYGLTAASDRTTSTQDQAAEQDELEDVESPRPRLVIARARSPEPELSAEELVDVLPRADDGPVPITDIAETSFVRDSTGLTPLDYVLGGGLVAASVVLLASPPGIGKTSLTLQALVGLKQRCLYVSGEETPAQVRGTAQRVDALSSCLFVLAETDLETIFKHAQTMRAQTIAIDSIQKMRCKDINGRPGTPGQLKECTARLVKYAKQNDTALWLIGHVTGDGDIAGPKTIEHDVDVVLELSQGTRFNGNERILRCPNKNRFGPTNAVGYFELTSKGHVPIDADGWDEEL